MRYLSDAMLCQFGLVHRTSIAGLTLELSGGVAVRLEWVVRPKFSDQAESWTWDWQLNLARPEYRGRAWPESSQKEALCQLWPTTTQMKILREARYALWEIRVAGAMRGRAPWKHGQYRAKRFRSQKCRTFRWHRSVSWASLARRRQKERANFSASWFRRVASE